MLWSSWYTSCTLGYQVQHQVCKTLGDIAKPAFWQFWSKSWTPSFLYPWGTSQSRKFRPCETNSGLKCSLSENLGENPDMPDNSARYEIWLLWFSTLFFLFGGPNRRFQKPLEQLQAKKPQSRHFQAWTLKTPIVPIVKKYHDSNRFKQWFPLCVT